MWGLSPDLRLPPGHLARAVDEIVGKLPLDRCNRRYQYTAGEPAYDVRGMVKLLIYAYARGITSSREMARQCEESIAFQFVTRGENPDFRTIARFRRKKRHLVRWVFRQTVQLGREMGLAQLGRVALDSVKMTANASCSKKLTMEQIQDELQKLDEYLRDVEASDQAEDAVYGSEQRGDELPLSLRSAQQRKEKLETACQILQARQSAAKREPPKDISPEDPEAAWVKNNGKVVRGYSGQVAADAEHQLIVAVKATAEPVDSEQLNPMLQEVEKTAGQAPEQLVADSGYYTDDAILQAAQSQTECIVPDSETAAQFNHPKRAESDIAAYHVSRFTYDEDKDEFTCPQGKRLPFVREGSRRGPTKIYRCADCHDCPFRTRCTENASGCRSIQVRADHAEVRKIREKCNTDRARAFYKQRKAIIEPIFGRWKHNWGVRRLRLRGLAGFSVELHLLAIAHNVTKLFKFQPGCVPVAAEG
jgi:transposase